MAPDLSKTVPIYGIHRRKYPDAPHYHHEATLLGPGNEGHWLRVSPGARVWRGTDVLGRVEHGAVVHVPDDDWFVAWFLLGGRADLYVDIATPPTWTDVGPVMVDLDFDVVRSRADGVAALVDADEFEEHRVALGYPPELEARARETAARIFDEVNLGFDRLATAAAEIITRIDDGLGQ